MASGKHSKKIRKMYKQELKTAVKQGANSVILKAVAVGKFWRLIAGTSVAINIALILWLVL